MARYIENLNSCTDPVSGDYFWIVDASAGATDKDRKVDAGLFGQKAVANTWTAIQSFSEARPEILYLPAADLGTSGGRYVRIERNSNASTPAPGFLLLREADNNAAYVYVSNDGLLRIHTAEPTNAVMGAGTIVGTQTSSLDSKDVLTGMSSLDDVLAAVQAGAEAVRRFTYKSGAFSGEEFEGVVIDYAPRYGMDRDEEHPSGKSLNLVNAVGDLLRAVAWLVEREQARA